MWLFQVNINTILTLQSQSVSWSFFCHRLFLLFRNACKCSDTVNSLSHEAPFTQSHVSEILSCVSVTHAILWLLFWIVFMNNQCFYSFLYWKSGLLPGFLFLLWIKLLCILLCKSFCEPVFISLGKSSGYIWVNKKWPHLFQKWLYHFTCPLVTNEFCLLKSSAASGVLWW